MANPFLKKAEEKKANPFLAKKNKTRGERQKAQFRLKRTRGEHSGDARGVKPREAAKKALAATGFIGIHPPELTGLKLLKRKREWAASDKEDYAFEGIKLCRVREWDGYWTIDVVNGNDTLRFDNRGGSWMLQLNGTGSMTEPVHWLKVEIIERWYKELKRQGRGAPYDGVSYFPTEEKKKLKLPKKGT